MHEIFVIPVLINSDLKQKIRASNESHANRRAPIRPAAKPCEPRKAC